MKRIVIDTNVLLAANNKHEDLSPACVLECIDRLVQAQKQKVVIDDGWRIINEYMNKTHPNEPKGAGDVFLKWLLQNKENRKCVEQVHLNELPEKECFEEFPLPERQQEFDPPDRKFVAVAHAHVHKPPVLQAADCKWLGWQDSLLEAGVTVDFLCPDDVERFYRGKYSGSA